MQLMLQPSPVESPQEIQSESRHPSKTLTFAALVIIAGASCLARLLLCLKGGEFYWSDETRYLHSIELAQAVLQLKPHAALTALAHTAHPLFTVTELPEAFLQIAYCSLFHATMESTLWLPAFINSLFTVLGQILVYAIARQLGAERREALLATLLTSCACGPFFYSRHLFPCDVSLALALVAVLIGCKKEGSRGASVAVGALATACALNNLGYWALSVMTIVAHSLSVDGLRKNHAQAFQRLITAGLSGALITGSIFGIASLAVSPKVVLAKLSAFSSSAIQGDFAEGWSHPFEYFAHSDGVFALIWVIGALACATFAIRRHAEYRAKIYAVLTIGLYGMFLLGSTIAHKFVLYARTDRALIPFLCLSTAFAFVSLERRINWRLGEIIGAAAVLNALLLCIPAFSLHYPNDIIDYTFSKYGSIRCVSTIGFDDWHSNIKSRLVLVNAIPLGALNKARQSVPDGKVIFAIPHPLNFAPYQYESYTPAERSFVRSEKPQMMLIDTGVVKP